MEWIDDQKFIAKFWSKVERSDGCWERRGARTKGYAVVTYRGRNLYAHRVSYALCHGPIPDGKFVLHHCDNPPCVRPDHLYVGTALENIHDAIARNRWQAWMTGKTMGPEYRKMMSEACKASPNIGRPPKLTPEQINEVRRLWDDEGLTYLQLGEMFGVCRETIINLIRRKLPYARAI